jgi:hypothetical protein
VVTLAWSAADATSGVRTVTATIDGQPITTATIDLQSLALGSHTFAVSAIDFYGNQATASVAFSIDATAGSLISTVNRLWDSHDIGKAGVRDSLLDKLTAAQASIAAGRSATARNQLKAFVNLVTAQGGGAITPWAATLLVDDARYLIAHL